MKRFSLFFIVGFIFSLNTVFSQSWVTVNPLPTPTNINGVSFINADTGFLAVGEDNIYRTLDGGNTWKGVPTNAADYFQDITSVSNKGYVIGHNNSIGRTDDFGETWNFITGPGYSTYWKIKFADPMHGWICGWYRTLLRTQDGGDSWQLMSQNVNQHENYFCLDFISKDTGYIAGSYGINSQGRLFRTFNGGVSVEEIELPNFTRVISDIEAVSYYNIWLCEGYHSSSNTILYHSTDAGLTWSTVELGTYPGSAADIEFLTPLKGRVLGDNNCFITEDGGVTWVQKQILTSGYNSAISTSWVNDSLAYISGYNGFIAKTENTGTTWQDLSQGSHASFHSIAFANNQTGCAVGSVPGSDVIYQTNDGGETWAAVLDSTVEYGRVCDITYKSESEVWASGYRNRVYHSGDGGNSWDVLYPTDDETNYYYSVCTVSDGRIYAGGSHLLYSDDNGENWQWSDFDCPGYFVQKIIFTDPLNGFLLLMESEVSTIFYGKMFRTRDGGLTWEDINYNVNGVSSKILAADFINKDTGIISIYGSGLATTTDGGITWTLQEYVPYMDIYYLKMFSEDEVVAVTYIGHVFYSFDGGLSWDQVEHPAEDKSLLAIDAEMSVKSAGNLMAPNNVDGLPGLFFTEMGKGWMCRDAGMIRKYTDLTVSTEKPRIMQPGGYVLYPNPASDFIQIKGDKKPDYISIINSQGKYIRQYNSMINKFDISGYAPGVYLVRIVTGNTQQTLRFVKQ